MEKIRNNTHTVDVANFIAYLGEDGKYYDKAVGGTEIPESQLKDAFFKDKLLICTEEGVYSKAIKVTADGIFITEDVSGGGSGGLTKKTLYFAESTQVPGEAYFYLCEDFDCEVPVGADAFANYFENYVVEIAMLVEGQGLYKYIPTITSSQVIGIDPPEFKTNKATISIGEGINPIMFGPYEN